MERARSSPEISQSIQKNQAGTHNHARQVTIELSLCVHTVPLEDLREVGAEIVGHRSVLIWAISVGCDADVCG